VKALAKQRAKHLAKGVKFHASQLVKKLLNPAVGV
jgi:hypothetical protein